MKWLQWTLADPFKEIGGAEIFALCVAEGLKTLGVDVHFSQDPQLLFDPKGFEVVQTHGSALPKWSSFKTRHRPKFRIHTLHGSSTAYAQALGISSMGLRKAALREYEGVYLANFVWSVVDDIAPLVFAKKLNRQTHYSINGWDSARVLDSVLDWPTLGSSDEKNYSQKWLFVGRAGDKAKAFYRISNLAKARPDLEFVAVPGLEDNLPPNIFATNKLKPSSVYGLMKQSKGLILSSHYEACPLVVLEALSLGLPVVSAHIENLKNWDKKFKNFFFVPEIDNTDSFAGALRLAQEQALPRDMAALANSKALSSWDKIAQKHFDFAQSFIENKFKD